MLVYKDRCFCARLKCPNLNCDRHLSHVPWSELPEYLGVSVTDLYGKGRGCPTIEPPLYWPKEGESFAEPQFWDE